MPHITLFYILGGVLLLCSIVSLALITCAYLNVVTLSTVENTKPVFKWPAWTLASATATSLVASIGVILLSYMNARNLGR
jgi:hypothetical protein